MSIESGDQPIVVYRGLFEEVLVLVTLLNGNEIHATMFAPTHYSMINLPCVYLPKQYLSSAIVSGGL